MNPIDLTYWNTLYLEGVSEYDDCGYMHIHPNKTNLSDMAFGGWIYGYDNIDISALKGEYYISVGTYNGHWHKYTKIYLA